MELTSKMIEEKTLQGRQLVVRGDSNSNYKQLNEWMNNLSLVDLISKRHGKSPITYQRSAVDPLDCIFGNPSLEIKCGGCLAFGKLISDPYHRGIGLIFPMSYYMDTNHHHLYLLKPTG